MVSEETVTSSFRKFRAKPFLMRGKDGLTRFYASGPESYGYEVPEWQRERELCDAIERFEFVDSIFQRVTLVPAIISIYAMGWGDRYSDRVFAALSVSIAIMVIGRVLERSWYFDELTVGLPRIEPLDTVLSQKKTTYRVLTGIAYFSFVFWRILRACGIA